MNASASASIEALITESFTKREGEDLYIPKDPGRREFRKCGIKKDQLLLQIEEVLFEIKGKGVPKNDLDLYAQIHGYVYFSVYSQIKDTGWILLPEEGTRYSYYLFPPDKNFNRKTFSSSTFLQIVSADEAAVESKDSSPTDHNRLFFTETKKEIVFAVADGEEFVLLKGKSFSSASSLINSYTPCLR